MTDDEINAEMIAMQEQMQAEQEAEMQQVTLTLKRVLPTLRRTQALKASNDS